MAKQTVNIGTSANARNGDPLRIAFDKINDNFDELYTALGLDEAPLNLGAFEFTGSVLTTTDSSAVVIDQATTITSNLTVGGDILPSGNLNADLGSATNRFRDIYLSGSTIDLGGLEISNVGGELKLDGVKLITQSELDVAIQNDITTNLTGSVFADDSTLLVDGINSALYGSTISITPNGSSNFAVGDFGYNVVTDGAYSSAIGGVFGITVGGDVSFNSGGLISLTGNEILLNALEENITLVSETGTQIITLDDAYGQQTYDFGVDGILTLPGKVVSPQGTDLTIATLDMTTGGADAIIIKGGDTSDSDNGAFGGNVFINGGRNPNALEQDGFVGIGLEYTHGVTIGAYDFGNGFGTNVSIAGVRNYIGEPLNRSVTYLRGTVDFSDATVSNLDVELSGDLTGSVFADDSTLLVDGVAGKIVGPIGVTTFEGTGAVSFNNDYFSDTFYGGFTTDKSILTMRGADYVGGGDNGGGITIAGGSARNGGNNGDVIIASGVGGADGTGIISLLSSYITASGTWIGTNTMDIKGSVFGDDSTVLVDGVNGVIPTSVLQGDISNDIKSSDIVIETTTSPGSISLTQTGIGNISISGTAIDFNNSPIQNFILSTLSSGLTAPGSAVVAGDTAITFNFSMAPTALTVEQDAITIGNSVKVNGFVGDIKGSVFGDDSTVLVDGVSGTIPASVVSGTITNDIFTNSLETLTDIRFGTYADARKPKISIAGIGEHDIAITAGYDVNGDDSGNVSINANTDGVTPGVVNIATSSGELSLGKSDGTTDVYGEVEFNGHILFQDGDGVEFNGPVDFSDATITGDIPGYVKIADLKTALQDGAGDYAAFKAWVLANL